MRRIDEAKTFELTVTRLRIADLDIPMISTVGGMQDDAAVHLVVTAGDPSLLVGDEEDVTETEIFWKADWLPDRFELLLLGRVYYR
jgi:hypothetical protein